MWCEEEYAKTIEPATILPVLRGLFKPSEFPSLTIKDVQARNADEVSEIEKETGLSGAYVHKYEDLQLLCDQLRTLTIKERIDFVYLDGIGMAVIGKSKSELSRKIDAIENRMKFVENARDYACTAKRLKGKIIVITGGAQGFGEGITRILSENGAHTIIADINVEKARELAAYLNQLSGAEMASAIHCDVTSEESVKEMCEWVTCEYGGIDVMLSNAGVCKAGDLEKMPLELFEKITKVNYTAYFLIAKYTARPMKIQACIDDCFYGDIIQTNSKAGLKGWIKNFAYCGSKFGSLGLTQSFAKELARYRIKVNAICPGNYYDGPLWADPEKGLFVEYFNAGKVQGAKSPDDVKNWYFSQELFNRGCCPTDVARAVMYCIEQLYETGQAIPVTGGLEMLN